MRPDGPGPEAGTRRKKPIALSVLVPSDDQGYPVLVGPGMLAKLGTELRRGHPAARRVALVSDANVMPLYGEAVKASLEAEKFEVLTFEVPAGESSKSPAQLLELVEGFVAARLSRRDVAVALGGGVVGDLAGLAAALFMRGIPVLQVPTTLLAQVDASVGGKVAVDLPAGKNLMGTFHFPTAVVVDPDVLGTLPDREFGCGLAEMLKHGALFSTDHFEDVVGVAEALYERDTETLARLVSASVALKAACVSRDPREQGEAGKGRVVLNLGHTVGHALEHTSNYELLHGEAVALGLVAAARVSHHRGIGDADLEPAIVAALRALRLPNDLDAWLAKTEPAELEGAMAQDKKREQGTITYVALTQLGRPTVLSLEPSEIVALLRA